MMKSVPPLDVQTEVCGEVPEAAVKFATAKIRSLLRFAPGPVLFARVTLTAAGPGGRRPAAVQAGLDLNGRRISARATAPQLREAVERVCDRLRIRLERSARNRTAARARQPVPGEWRHTSVPTRPVPYFPRPADERTIIPRRSYALARQTVDQAAADLDLLGYDFHLFTERASGQDSVIYRDDRGYCLDQARPMAGHGPVHLPVNITRQPAPRLAPAVAGARLEALGVPFLFFVNAEDGHGSVIYHRYDGHYGLISPPPRG